MKPIIFGLNGPVITPDERAFFAHTAPAGFILFSRNIEDRDQLRALTDELRTLTGRDDLPVLIDQEGGPVARLRPPIWPVFPAGPAFGALYEVAPISAIEAARINAQAIAATLREVGITVDCLPLLDVARDETTPAIATRALGRDPLQVAALGRAVLDGLARGGVIGVIKHMPGHGRARLDTHFALPIVDASEDELMVDLAPFRALAQAPMGMTAHIVYTAWDATRPATLSPIVIDRVIRGLIGFDGLLMTDDIDMKALDGSPADKAAAAIAAGCDVVLDCWGRIDDMAAIADRLDEIGPVSRGRLDRALVGVVVPANAAIAELVAARDALFARGGIATG